MKAISIVLAILPLGLGAGQAAAHEHYRRPAPLNGWNQPPGEEIRAATERAQHEPGVTEELAPDAKQTATGGPSGGVPGFSGH